jgi:hypothetical protein
MPWVAPVTIATGNVLRAIGPVLVLIVCGIVKTATNRDQAA